MSPSTSTASIGWSSAARAHARAPVKPAVAPDVETSTSVLESSRARKRRASSSSTAVPDSSARPGRPSASRWATTTTRRLDRPERTPTTVSTPAARSCVTLKAGRSVSSGAASVSRTRSASAASSAEPGARSGKRRPSSVSELRSALRPPPNARSPSKRFRRLRRGRGRRAVLERERGDEQRHQRGQEGSPIHPDVEHRASVLRSILDADSTDGRSRPPNPARRRRAADPDAPLLPAPARRLRGGAGVRRPRSARPLLRAAVRPRGARPDAPADGRARSLQDAARPGLDRPDHHAHGQVGGDRQGPRARARRRRLHHQAVLDARVPLAREGGAAARRHGAAGRGRRRRPDRGPRPAHRPDQAHGGTRRRRGRDHVRRVRDPDRAGARSRPRLHARHAAGQASGATPPTATRARSTSTSATCARRSRATRRSPSTSSPCAASATGSGTTRSRPCPACGRCATVWRSCSG